ncbi:MAG: helix-turn-helix domain-containing protein [Elusimicrobiota bacterium]
MSAATPPFSRLVAAAMARRGLGLRELCRRAALDPSFFSKVLAGKRNPPSEEGALRRVAGALELDPVEVIVSAGIIPSDWSALWSDSELVRAVHSIATGGRPPRRPPAAAPARPASAPAAGRGPRPAPPPAFVPPPRGLSEELL